MSKILQRVLWFVAMTYGSPMQISAGVSRDLTSTVEPRTTDQLKNVSRELRICHSGSTLQSDVTHDGNYYKEIRVKHFRELVTALRKNQTDDNDPGNCTEFLQKLSLELLSNRTEGRHKKHPHPVRISVLLSCKANATTCIYNLCVRDNNQSFLSECNNFSTSLHSTQKRNEEQKCVNVGGKFCSDGYVCTLSILSCVLFLPGLLGNSVLIFIFIRHSEMRSDNTLILINMVIFDVIFLICNTLIPFTQLPKDRSILKLYVYTYNITNAMCIYSVVALSIQRWLAVFSAKNCRVHNFTARFGSLFLLWSAWIVAIISASIRIRLVYSKIFPSLVVFNLIAYCAIPLVTMATFCTLTFLRLRESVQELPKNCQRTVLRSRVRSSNVLIALIVVFIVSNVPAYILRPLINRYSNVLDCIDIVGKIFYLFQSVNSCFNPVALYIVSRKFRRYFNRYLFCCVKKKPVSQVRTKHSLPFQIAISDTTL